MEQFAKASDSVLKPIVIGFLLGFTAVGATRLGAAPEAPDAGLTAAAHAPATGAIRAPSWRQASFRGDCDRPAGRLIHPLI